MKKQKGRETKTLYRYCRKCRLTVKSWHTCGRPIVDSRFNLEALSGLQKALQVRLQEKGPRAFASTHEVLGIITEEFHELVDAVRSNDRPSVAGELMDIAVACIFGLACIKSDAMDW